MTTDPPPAAGNRFVVQHHRATRPHYDVRLEAAGVLLSWAVPKGPTLDPDVRRMAVHVEDHPLDYFDFEGVIAAGGYGAGDVIVWDWGTWELAKGDDPLVAVAKGDLHFDLVGEKLAGRFALVRRGDDKQWLLIKKHDDAARPGWEPGDHPRSVKSGRTNDEVRDAPAATWSSDEIWAAPTTEELAALDELGRGGTWRFGDRQLELTDLDAVVVRGVTRRDLVRHHAVHAPVMLPYLAGRTVDTPAALVEEVAGGAVALHAPTTTVADPDHPTWVVMDIRADDIEDALVVARLHRAALDHLDIDARPVVLGDGGVQVWIPIARRYTRDQADQWAGELATAIRSTVPDLAGVAHGATEQPVAPFSVRPSPTGPVAVPITWAELDEPLPRWTVGDVGERIERAGDPLAPLVSAEQRLPRL